MAQPILMNTKCSSAKCSRQTDIRGMHSLIRVPGIPTASRVEAGKIKMCLFEAAGVAHTRRLQVSIALGLSNSWHTSDAVCACQNGCTPGRREGS